MTQAWVQHDCDYSGYVATFSLSSRSGLRSEIVGELHTSPAAFLSPPLEWWTRSRAMLLTCQAGFEGLFVRELTEQHHFHVAESGPGWVRADSELPNAADTSATSEPKSDPQFTELAFAHLTLMEPTECRGDSVNALATAILEWFLASVRDERIESRWPNVWWGPAELVGLGRRISAVESAVGDLFRKRFSRVSKLATFEIPRGVGRARGLWVFFVDFGRVLLARDAFVHGPRRMADDVLAPSRSYLKVEEAYVTLGREPQPKETVCDLGAAPGGWSYSAAKRGARVVAIDNGPLKGGALNHPDIVHRREDAFRYTPGRGERFDWLFCDLVEEPHHVLRHLVEPWLVQRWCRRFVVNLKFGRVDPIALLGELKTPESPLVRCAVQVRVQHLFHDREEFTITGEVNG